MSAPRLIYGFHPIRETLRQKPQTITEVLVAARPSARREEIVGLCQRHRVSYRDAAFVELERLLEGIDQPTHNGFVALVEEAGEAAAASSGDGDLIVLVEDVQDPRNLGALLRVCEAAGVGKVLIRDRGSAPITPTVEKTSAGATRWLDIERVTNSSQEIERLKKDGYWIYGTDSGGQHPWQLDLKGKVVLCFGGEEKGLRHSTRKHCDAMVGLPMRGHIESLNLSTAVSAILYEALRQRNVTLSSE